MAVGALGALRLRHLPYGAVLAAREQVIVGRVDAATVEVARLEGLLALAAVRGLAERVEAASVSDLRGLQVKRVGWGTCILEGALAVREPRDPRRGGRLVLAAVLVPARRST